MEVVILLAYTPSLSSTSCRGPGDVLPRRRLYCGLQPLILIRWHMYPPTVPEEGHPESPLQQRLEVEVASDSACDEEEILACLGQSSTAMRGRDLDMLMSSEIGIRMCRLRALRRTGCVGYGTFRRPFIGSCTRTCTKTPRRSKGRHKQAFTCSLIATRRPTWVGLGLARGCHGHEIPPIVMVIVGVF